MEKQITTEKFLLRIDSETKEAIEKQAKEQNRSLNGHILQCIKKALNPDSTRLSDIGIVLNRNKQNRDEN